MVAALEVVGLTLRFGGVTAIEGLHLSLSPGVCLGLAGPNGSGKSSLINILTGHYHAEGSIRFDDHAIDHLSVPDRVRLGITRTFQSPRAFRRMSVLDNVKAARHATAPLSWSRIMQRRETERARESLSALGILHLADAMPDDLSPYELRLLELARAKVADARLLLLDEPVAGATQAEAEKLRHILAEQVMPGRTVILIEHRLDILKSLCSQIAVLQTGRLLALGAPDHVFARSDVRRCLIGDRADA